MKSRDAITCKIDALIVLAQAATDRGDFIQEEQLCCQIDALLWAIDDTSGAPLLDERLTQ